MTNHEDAHRVPEGTPPAPRISLALSAEQARAVATGSAGGSSAVLPASQDCAAPGRSGPVVYLAVRDAADEAGDLLGVQVLGVFECEDDARMVRGAERVEAHPVHTGPPSYTAAYRIRWRTWRPDGPAEPPYSIPNPWPHSFEAVEPVDFDVHWESHGLPGYLLQVTGPDEDAVRELYEQERAAYERGAWRAPEVED